MAMTRRQIQIHDRTWKLVSLQSAREGCGKGDLVRKAVAAYLDSCQTARLLDDPANSVDHGAEPPKES